MSGEVTFTPEAILQQVIHKIPGNPIHSKKEKQGYVNLNEKSNSELLELVERQDKLLKNKAFINKLPDKGEKILNYKNQLEDEIKNREKSDQLSDMLLKLNINGKEALDKLEWAGNCNPGQSKSSETKCEEDDDDERSDVFKIIASHSGTRFHKKINRVLPPEEPLIKQSDIEFINENKSYGNSDSRIIDSSMTTKPSDQNQLCIDELYIKNLCDKFDNNNSNVQERFLPHRTLLNKQNGDKTVNKEKQINKNSNWEVTAATPPLSIFNEVKLLPLETSVKLQIQQAENLKVIQMKHATDKLKAMSGRGSPTSNMIFSDKSRQFRDTRVHYDSSSSSSSESDDEDDKQSFHSCNNDEEENTDEKRDGIVFYNLIDN